MINARMETVAEKPAYRRAFAVAALPAARRRLLRVVPHRAADGKAGKPRKQPFFIRPKDDGMLAMAGLYEIWRDPERGEDDPDRFRWTCTVLTTEAEDAVGHIHDRMPLMVEPDRWGAWLDPARRQGPPARPARPGRARQPRGLSRSRPLVSNVRNNGPELLEPLPLEDVP